jgi:hypothetical protein
MTAATGPESLDVSDFLRTPNNCHKKPPQLVRLVPENMSVPDQGHTSGESDIGSIRNLQSARGAGSGLKYAVVVLMLVGVMGGCQSVNKQEMAWQALHAVDVSQTLNAASDPCYREASWMTKRLIGSQPSDTDVMIWGIATSMAHMWISKTLEERNAPGWLQVVWDLGTIGHTGHAVVNNHRNGVRAWGDNVTHDQCYRP